MMRYLLLTLAAAALLAGCKKKDAAPGAPAGGPPKMETQVVAVEAKRQSVADKISLVGSLLANEAIELKSEIDGTVQEIKFQEGQRVEKGQLLVQMDERKLAAAVSAAEADFKISETTFERSKQLYNDKLVSKQEYDQAGAAFQARQADLELRRQMLRDAHIIAPFSGIVGAREISPGQVISKNTTLTWITDLDPIKVEIQVPERYIAQLRVGQTIDIAVAGAAGKKFHGEVYFISPQVDQLNRTVLVKAKVPNPDAVLKPGMLATLDLTLNVRENAVVIPEAALARVMDNGRAMIFVVDGESSAQMKPITLGVRLVKQVEVLEGLQGGETVIVEGTQKIGPGSKVKLAPPEASAPYLPTNAVSAAAKS